LVDQKVVPNIDGAREAIFREATILARKFSHCRTLVEIAVVAGRSTWAAIAAYEACFYGAKAFCYLLGFASVARSSPFYLDAFFPVTEKRGKRLTEERYDMKFHRLPERLTHAVLWGLTERLIATTTFDGDLADLNAALRTLDWDDFSHFRNSLMYDGAYWTKLDNYQECDLVNFVSDISIYRASKRDGSLDAIPYGLQYFRGAGLLESTLSLMFSDLARLAPALAVEAAAVRGLSP
jgi:hypothetical protein